MLSPRSAALFGIVFLLTAAPQKKATTTATTCSTITATAVGTQNGAFTVNGSGAAAYEMDIDVPPGTHGVQPKLSIWYGSQSSNGLLGNGFSLQGLSSIQRCQASLKLDGYNGGVAFDEKDRFCLDGQRLVKISGTGDYGAAGSVYHTENETWTQITAVGTCGDGPCSFTAQNKDGMTLIFGTDDSGVPLPNRLDIAAWQIKTSTDLNGNQVSVSYTLDATTLQNLPTEIRYTENTAAGISATRKVTFEYEARSQTIPRYVGGYLFSLTQRLKAVRTWLDDTEILDYFLSYQTSDGTGRDLLCSLQKCTPGGVCFPATTFAYQQETNSLVSPNSSALGTLKSGWCSEDNALIGWADFNADGLPDVHCDTETGTHRVLLSTGTGLVSPNSTADGTVKTGWCTGDGFLPSWLDFNGDSKADLGCNGDDGTHRVLLSTGTTVTSPNSSAEGLVKSGWCAGDESFAQWGNFNADGRADLLCYSRDGVQRALVSTGTSVVSPNTSGEGIVKTGWCTASDATMFWSDFNGDQLADAHCATQSGVLQVLLSNGTSLVSPNSDATGTVKTSWCAGDDKTPGVTDFNNDGLHDATCDSSDGSHWVLLSTGTELVSPSTAADGLLKSGWCTGDNATSEWSDFNGDGLADLQCRDGNSPIMALLSTGTALKSPNSSAEGVLKTSWCLASAGTPDWVDFNGDSLGDVTCHTAGLQQALVHTTGAPDLVSKITDGVGMTVDVTYAALTDSSVYTVGDAVTYPTLDVRSPMYVVSRYVTGDGRGGEYAFSYGYTGARTDLEEQRWMGFQKVTFTEEAIGRKTVTSYLQEYPLISFNSSTSVYDANGTMLSSIAYTPLIRNPYTNVWEVLTATETTATYTLGVADYTEVKTYEYDDYGNTQYVSDVSSPYFEVYTCQKYDNSTDPWRMGYPTGQKITRTAQACRDFLTAEDPVWNAATDLRWNVTEYDARMNAITQKAWDDGNSVFLTSQRTFNDVGGILTKTDLAGNVTTYTWDESLTYPTTQISPPLSDGRHLTTSFTYHRAFGVPATTTDPNGNTQSTLIDGFGRTIEVRGPDPVSSSGAALISLQTYTYAQDTTGRYVEMRQRQTWTEGDTANWYYSRQYQDGMSRVFLIKSRSARTTDVLIETLFDAAGRPWKTAVPHYSDASPEYVVTLYDLLDRPTTITQPDTTVEKIEYLKGEIEVKTTYAYGTSIARTTVDSKDPRSLELKNTAPNGGVTTQTFSPVGEMLTSVRPTGSSTQTTYDSLGRPVQSIDSDSGTTTWSYGTSGLLRSTTNGAGNTVTYTYDSLDRPSRRTLIPASGAPEVYLFQYDNTAYANAQGALTTVIGPSYSQDYAYSKYSQVSFDQLTIDGNVYVDTIDYDPPGQLALRTFADGSQVRTTRYTDGTLARQELKESGGDYATYAEWTSYTSMQQPEAVLYGNGLRTDNTYYPISESMQRPKTMSVAPQSSPDSTILTRSYTWTQLTELSSLQTMRTGQSLQSETFVHDNMGWLTSATGPYGTLTYAYDLAGNITQQEGTTYTYVDSSDRLLKASNDTTFSYDGAGNLNRKQGSASTWQYTHDAASRLTQVLLDDAAVATHLYDSDDRRIRRVDGSGNISLYVGQDIDLHQSGNTVLLTKYVSGVTGPAAAVTATYTPQALRSTVQKQQALLDPARYNTHSLRGFALWSVSVARAILVRGADHAMPIAALMVFLAGSLFLFWRAQYVRRHPLYSAFIPFLICGLVLLSAEEMKADLESGAGYPTTGTLYFQGDQVFSVILTTKPDGTESTNLAYTPFGSIDQPRSSGPNNFRPKFTTKERDDESGLDYFQSRYYDAQTGRFLEPDPQGQFTSPYVYAGNDPVDMYDPDGQLALFAVVMIAAAIGALIGAYMGGVSVNNNNYNPFQWDWSSGRTLAGVLAGAAIGAASGAIGAAVGGANVAAGIVTEIVLSAGENAAFTALSGGSEKQILESAEIGAAFGAVTAGIGEGVSAAFSRAASMSSRLARRADEELVQPEVEMAEQFQELPCSSFPAGTLVAGAHGLEPIENVTASSSVLAKEDQASNVVPFPVVATHSRRDAPLVAVDAGGTTVKATPEHPFWVETKGWIGAGALRPGDMLVTVEGGRVPVERVIPAGSATVFNFEVDRAHTYFVSQLRLLVHNVPCTRAKRKEAIKKTGFDPHNQIHSKRVSRPPIIFGKPVYRYGPAGPGVYAGGIYVNFGAVMRKQFRFNLTGTYAGDFAIADAKAGITALDRAKRGLTWHHVADVGNLGGGQYPGTMQLIPQVTHNAWPHKGGAHQYRQIVGSGYGL